MLRAMLGKSPLAFSVPDFLHRVLVGWWLSTFEALHSGEKPGLAGVVWVVCPPPLILTGAHSSPGYGRNLPNQPPTILWNWSFFSFSYNHLATNGFEGL